MARLLVLVFVFFLAGCGGEPDYANWTPVGELEFAEHFIDLVRNKEFDTAASFFDFRLAPATQADLFRGWAMIFPAQHLVATHVVDRRQTYKLGNIHRLSTFLHGPSDVQTALTVRSVFANDDAVDTYFVLQRKLGGFRIEAIRFVGLSHQQIADNRVDAAKPSGAILILVIAFGAAAFLLATFLACLFGPVPSWRWRWLLLILIPLGVGRLSFNWTTGMWSSQLLFLHIPGVVMSKASSYDPLWISLSVPVFAIYFWSMRWRWLERRSPRQLDHGPSQANTRAINSDD